MHLWDWQKFDRHLHSCRLPVAYSSLRNITKWLIVKTYEATHWNEAKQSYIRMETRRKVKNPELYYFNMKFS